MVDDCIFCKIISKERPAAIFYENDEVIAFLDAFPAVEGHSVVIPKHHSESLRTSPREFSQVVNVIPHLAQAVVASVNAGGVNILCNDGQVAGQVVPHLHFHIIPRRKGDNLRWGERKNVDLEKLRQLALEFQKKLEED